MAVSGKGFPECPAPQPTGRSLVFFKPGVDASTRARLIADKTGARVLDIRDFQESATVVHDLLSAGSAVVIDRFGLVVVDLQNAEAARASESALADLPEVETARPEFYLYITNQLQQRYSEWARNGLRLLADGVGAAVPATSQPRDSLSDTTGRTQDTDERTWGVAAVGADYSAYTGRGIRVAVLDTGLDFNHPDFKGRNIVKRSFVKDEDEQDVQGHGTHTAGTAAGPQQSTIGRRYGVAPDAELYIGKVLNKQGAGKEADIMLGMSWAITEKCAVISMSLGRPTRPGEAPAPEYDNIGAAALREGSLIVAAAGNESARAYGYVAPVDAPANSVSIMAVAACDAALAVAPFSNGGINPQGGEVNLTGPGMAVYSSYPEPRLSRVLQGTSMACPHVAGVAALWAESDARLRGQALWDALVRSAQPTGRESSVARDFGAGLVQTPAKCVSPRPAPPAAPSKQPTDAGTLYRSAPPTQQPVAKPAQSAKRGKEGS